MKHIQLTPKQHIEFEMEASSTVKQALTEAVAFANENPLVTVDVTCNGFLFDIDPDSDVNAKLLEYNEWVDMRAIFENA